MPDRSRTDARSPTLRSGDSRRNRPVLSKGVFSRPPCGLACAALRRGLSPNECRRGLAGGTRPEDGDARWSGVPDRIRTDASSPSLRCGDSRRNRPVLSKGVFSRPPCGLACAALRRDLSPNECRRSLADDWQPEDGDARWSGVPDRIRTDDIQLGKLWGGLGSPEVLRGFPDFGILGFGLIARWDRKLLVLRGLCRLPSRAHERPLSSGEPGRLFRPCPRMVSARRVENSTAAAPCRGPPTAICPHTRRVQSCS